MPSVSSPPDHGSALRVRTGSGLPSGAPGATQWRPGGRGPPAANSRAKGGQLVFKLWPVQQVHGEALQQRVGLMDESGEGSNRAPPLISGPHDLCNDVSSSSKKSKSHKKPSNTTKSTPSNTTERPHLSVTNPLRKNISKPPTQEPHGRLSLASSPGSR